MVEGQFGRSVTLRLRRAASLAAVTVLSKKLAPSARGAGHCDRFLGRGASKLPDQRVPRRPRRRATAADPALCGPVSGALATRLVSERPPAGAGSKRYSAIARARHDPTGLGLIPSRGRSPRASRISADGSSIICSTWRSRRAPSSALSSDARSRRWDTGTGSRAYRPPRRGSTRSISPPPRKDSVPGTSATSSELWRSR